MSTRLFGRISSSIALVAESARDACHLNARALRWGQPLARGRRPRRPLPLLHRHAVKRGPRTPAFRFLFGERGPDVDFCYAIPKRRSVRFKAEQVLLKAVPCAQSSAATRSTASNAASHSPERHASSLANNHGYAAKLRPTSCWRKSRDQGPKPRRILRRDVNEIVPEPAMWRSGQPASASA